MTVPPSKAGDHRDRAHPGELTLQQVRRVATLSRLALSDEQLEAMRPGLAAVLAHVRMLGELDLAAVEPMAHPLDAANRWDEDVPRAELPNDALMAMAPDTAPPFIKVPKVLGDGGSA